MNKTLLVVCFVLTMVAIALGTCYGIFIKHYALVIVFKVMGSICLIAMFYFWLLYEFYKWRRSRGEF